MASQTPKNWANGLFAKEMNSQYGQMISLGILENDFIDWLANLPANENGFKNIILAPGKEGDRWNAWESVDRPQQNGQRNSGGQRRGSAPPQQRPANNNRQQNNFRQNAPARNTTPQGRGRQAPQNNQDEDDGGGLPF